MKSAKYILYLIVFFNMATLPNISVADEGYFYSGEDKIVVNLKRIYSNTLEKLESGLIESKNKLKTLKPYYDIISLVDYFVVLLQSLFLAYIGIKLPERNTRSTKWKLGTLQIILIVIIFLSTIGTRYIDNKTEYGIKGLPFVHKQLEYYIGCIKNGLTKDLSQNINDNELTRWQGRMFIDCAKATDLLNDLNIVIEPKKIVKPGFYEIDPVKKNDDSTSNKSSNIWNFNIISHAIADTHSLTYSKKDRPCWVDYNPEKCRFFVDKYVYIKSKVIADSEAKARDIALTATKEKLLQLTEPTIQSICNYFFPDQITGMSGKLKDAFSNDIIRYGKVIDYIERNEDQVVYFILFEIDPAAIEYMLLKQISKYD